MWCNATWGYHGRITFRPTQQPSRLLVGYTMVLFYVHMPRKEPSAFYDMCEFFSIMKHFSPSSAEIQPICSYICHILYIHATIKIGHLLSHPWNQLETHVQNIRPQTWWQQSNLRPDKPGQTSRASSMHLRNIAACSGELARSKMSFQFIFH